MGIVDIDVKGILDGGAGLIDSIGGLFNADEKAKTEIAKLVHSSQDKLLQLAIKGEEEATKRAVADSQSSNEQTKTIRPKLAIHATIVITVLTIILLAFAFLITPTVNQVKIVEYLLYFWGAVYISIIGFYFTPKGFEVMHRVKNSLNLTNSISPRSTAPGITDSCIKCGSKEVEPNQFYCKTCKGE